MASGSVDHLDQYSHIASRISGSEDFEQAYAEHLYERFCHSKLNKSKATSRPVDLQLLALEAFRKQLFIKEWLSANKRSWVAGELVTYDYTVFKEADSILRANVSELCDYIYTHLGINLRGNRYVKIFF